MTSVHSLKVNASAARAWAVIGDDFVAVDKWMAANPSADAIEGPALPGAPARGRNSYMIQKFAPMYQEELITDYNEAHRTISTQVTLRNGPKMMPLLGYNATISITPIDEATCQITYRGEARTKWFSRPMKNMLTKSMDAGFLRGLEEVAHFIETGEPHPRKVEKIKSEAALAAA